MKGGLVERWVAADIDIAFAAFELDDPRPSAVGAIGYAVREPSGSGLGQAIRASVHGVILPHDGLGVKEHKRILTTRDDHVAEILVLFGIGEQP